MRGLYRALCVLAAVESAGGKRFAAPRDVGLRLGRSPHNLQMTSGRMATRMQGAQSRHAGVMAAMPAPKSRIRREVQPRATDSMHIKASSIDLSRARLWAESNSIESERMTAVATASFAEGHSHFAMPLRKAMIAARSSPIETNMHSMKTHTSILLSAFLLICFGALASLTAIVVSRMLVLARCSGTANPPDAIRKSRERLDELQAGLSSAFAPGDNAAAATLLSAAPGPSVSHSEPGSARQARDVKKQARGNLGVEPGIGAIGMPAATTTTLPISFGSTGCWRVQFANALGSGRLAYAPRELRVAARAFGNDEDVVVVYDPSSRQAGEVVMAVEQDNARSPRPVAYRALPSTDTAAIAALLDERGLGQELIPQLQRPASVVAVLPSGALIEDLQMDPGPLVRELRYRTCLEKPSLDEQEQLEQFMQPLRILRERWWWNPMAMNVLVRQLAVHNFVLVDNFLPDALANSMRSASEALYSARGMQPGQTTGGQNRVGLPHRGDFLTWLSFDGDGEAEASARAFTECVEVALAALQQCAARELPAVASALAGVRWRSEAMMTCYPKENRARYFRHSDNSSNNGRLLTAIVYLNRDWQPGDGGELRLFQPGAESLKIKTEVAPLWNRLILFWSDDRCPHEVLSACQDRYACTVWYYDGMNPNIRLTEVSSNAGTAG